nr:sulfiredoxin, chloroplastic/mitochondrial [Tanacetum cinerariifolium]
MVRACQGRPQTAPIRRVEAMEVEGLRRRGRPKLRWEDRLKQDMNELLLAEDMTSDRNAWRDRIRISGFRKQLSFYVQIDVLEVDGAYYGFSGCHRFEAHQRLGLPTIRCKIRRGTKETLRHHLR